MTNQILGLDPVTQRLKYMRVTAQSIGKPRDSSAQKLPIRNAWDHYIDSFISEKAPKGLENVY